MEKLEREMRRLDTRTSTPLRGGLWIYSLSIFSFILRRSSFWMYITLYAGFY
jgi:hypothetical protein